MNIFGAPFESEGPGWYLLNSSKAHAPRGRDKCEWHSAPLPKCSHSTNTWLTNFVSLFAARNKGVLRQKFAKFGNVNSLDNGNVLLNLNYSLSWCIESSILKQKLFYIENIELDILSALTNPHTVG